MAHARKLRLQPALSLPVLALLSLPAPHTTPAPLPNHAGFCTSCKKVPLHMPCVIDVSVASAGW